MSTTFTPPRPDEAPLRFTHSGHDHVLGYGEGFYGIWARSEPSTLLERFPRTDRGWSEAWNRFFALEPRAVVTQAQPAPSHHLRPPTPKVSPHRSLATWATVLVGVSAAMAAIAAVGFVLVTPVGRAPGLHGPVFDDPRALAHLQWVPNAALVFASISLLIALLIAPLPWLLWERRALANASSMSGRRGRSGDGGAVLWWFVPVAWFVMPFLTMRGLVRRTAAATGAPGGSRMERRVLLWWAAVIVTIAGYILSGSADDGGSLALIFAPLAVANVALAFAGVEAIRIVRWATRAQLDHASANDLELAWEPGQLVAMP